MATPIEALKNRANLMKDKLTESPTAYAPNTLPTSTDVSTSKQLSSINKQIEDLRSKQIRNKWYGSSDDTTEEAGSSDGVLIGGLKALQRPLNAVVGTAQYALGKGTESSLTENINQAMKTGLVFGDVLKQAGAPRGVQVPLGFALDVMFDPVNWATVGTAALIPRVGMGAIKGLKTAGLEGAVKAAGTGLVSGLEKKAATALNIIPFAKASTKYKTFAENVGKKAVEGATKYDTMIGKTVYDKLGKGLFGMPSGIIGKTAEDLVRKTPTGEKIADFFKYSPMETAKIADLKDKIINLAKDKGAILVRNEAGANFQNIDEFLKPNATIGLKDKTGEIVNIVIKEADGSIKPEFFNQVKVVDNIENAKALLDIAGDDYNLKHLAEAYKVTHPGKTGIQWYDDVIDKLKNTTLGDLRGGHLGPIIERDVTKDAGDLVKTWNSYNKVMDLKPFEKMLSAQQNLISIFKSAKVPMNVSSHIVATVGNFFMGAMMGLPVWKPGYVQSMMKANMLVKGRLGAAGFREMFFDDINSLINLADDNPTRFKQLTGIDPREIAGKLSIEEKLTRVLRPNSTFSEVQKVLGEAWDSVDEGIAQGERLSSFENVANEAVGAESLSKITKKTMKEELGRFETPSESIARLTKEAPVRKSEEFGSWMTGEITPNARLDQMKKWLAVQAEKQPYNPAVRLANTIVNSMPRWYEHIDQTFKIGTADYLTKIGLTEQELVMISRTIPLTKADILEPVIKGGEKLYRLTPLKASEVATEAYMNYSAMPDFVRLMRAIPIAGSPFYSFPYAMAIKTAKTAINNPALFNKVGYMMNEMNVGRTPEEKIAMEEKYNTYLKSPTVVKMFGMWNTNVKNFIPYYTMNLFSPSERTYDNSTQGQILKMTDKLPIFQDPVGGVIKDYFIQPWILSGSGQTAQGQFGQPLYPSYDETGKKIDATLGTKALYGARTLGEAVVPGSLSYAGLINAPLGLSPTVVDFVPSYGFRNLANATQGRSSIGAMTKEDAVRKTLRSLLGRTGIPAYTLDVTKTSTQK